jgi:hypothetical protein
VSVGSEENEGPGRRRWLLLAAPAVIVGCLAGAAFGVRGYLVNAFGRANTGTVVIDTSPSSVPIAIDGHPRGSTPITITLNAGSHVLELTGGDESRTIRLNVKAGTQVSQYIELGRSETRTGQLDIRTEPPGAKVSVDGQLRGASPLTVTDLTPGPHSVTLENEFRSLSQSVVVQAGVTNALLMPLGGGVADSTASGWVTLTTPVDTQLYENGRLIGNSQIDRIMMPAGRHDVEIVNQTLQYRVKRTIDVVPGQVLPIKPDWPKGSVSLNALPWADVWVDGQRIGETPIGNLALSIGPHEVVFRHPELGNRTYAITTLASSPTRLSVDMTKQ